MKKLLIAEIAVLAVLLVALVVTAFLPRPETPPDVTPGTSTSENTTESNNTTSGLPEDTSTADTTENTTTDTTEDIPVGPVVNTTEQLFIPTWKTYPDDRQMLAKAYFVYDLDSETFLLSSGQNEEKIYPASITKLFTAYVALQYLSPEDTVTAGEALDLLDWDSSVADIQKGDTVTVEQLIAGMMLPSGNDAAYLLAERAGKVITAKDSTYPALNAVKAFVNEMNTQAAKLGMTGTHFMNPDGIHDDNHYTTMNDLTVLGSLARKTPLVMKYASVAKLEVTLHGQTVTWRNSNLLIDPSTPYYCPHAVGLKTGTTLAAGNCLLSLFEKDGQTLLIGVFGCPEMADRFDDTLFLFNKIVLK